MFTALPSGIVSASTAGTVVSLSVYVTPQLLAGASLTAAPGFADWPRVAKALAFQVVLGTGAGAPVAPCNLDPNPSYATDRFDSQLWAAIFGPPPGASSSAVSVNLFAVPDYTASGVLSYGAAPVSAAVKSAYRSVAALTAKPTIARGGADLLSTSTANVANALNVPSAAGSATYVNAGHAILNTVKGSISSAKTALSGDALKALQASGQVASTPHAEFARVAAFHNRKNYRALTPSQASGTTTAIQLDFHQIIGHLADHPAIMRRLGLVIDLQFTVPANAGDGPTNIFVQPTAGSASALQGLTVASPVTYSILHSYGSSSAVAFRPYYGDVDAPAGGTGISNPLIDTNGLVRIDDPTILTVDDLDVDHAAIHVANYAEQAHSDLAAEPTGALEVTLPALRTSGLALHHSNREQLIGLRFAQNAGWQSGNTFVAEDFLRGFRVDVRTVTGSTASPWKSLCARQSVFAFSRPGVGPITITDEGYVKSSAMSASSSDPVYNVNESLFHWDGWSLVASRPGLSVGVADAPVNGDGTRGPLTASDGPVAPVNSGAALNLPFSNTITARSLTKLRFGYQYQFRVRAVDLAGNDMLAAAASDNPRPHASPVVPFSRYEPVSPPVLQLRKAVTEGESVERLVIRSDPYASPPVYAADWATNNSASPAGTAAANAGMNAYYPTSERHVAAPKTSVQMAEWHGAFDKAIAGAANPAQAAWAIASKEEGGFYDSTVTDSTTGAYRSVTQPGRTIVTPPFSAPLVAQAKAAGEPAFTGTDEIFPRGSSLVNGQYVVFDADSIMLPYLPDPNAIGVAFTGFPTGTQYRPFAARALNPAGHAWPELDTWRLVLTESQSGFGVNGVNPSPAAGAPPASTAVTVALPAASVLELQYSSMLDNPAAHAFCPTASGDVANAKSGLLPLLSPPRKVTLVHAVQRPKAPGLVDGDIGPTDRKQGETAQTILATLRFDGASSASVDLISSWNEFIDQAGVADPTQPIPHSGAIATVTPGSSDTIVPNKVVRQLFGDTKRRDITYSTKATTRFREYFPASITNDSTKITNTTTLSGKISCKSSARPPIPKVMYAVPSFIFNPATGGAPSVSGSTTTSVRTGGVVRVYVDRGWFATGEGECLGVVLAAQPSDITTLPNLVSQWGLDPIWYRATNALSTLDISHVNLATTAGIYTGVALAEGVGTVNVATFAPNFNAARGLWYFDIGLNTDQAYFPFLRLALVRFQPESIANPNGAGTLQASPVVLTEFVQLSAGRTASVVNAGGGSYNVSLSGVTAPNVAGLSNQPVQVASGHTVTAEFQQATTASPDDIDWVTIGSATMLAPSSVSGPNGTNVTYSASVAFPSFASITGAKHRIMIKEYEVFATDNQTGVRQGLGVVQIGGSSVEPYTQRIVYADAIAIPS